MREKFSFKRLRLQQQLIAVVLITTTVLMLLSMFVLSAQITKFVNREMYSTIRTFQNQVIYRLNLGITKSEQLFDSHNTSVTHIIYDNRNQQIIYNEVDKIDTNVLQHLIESSKNQVAETQNYQLNLNQAKNLYTITKVNDHQNIISVMSMRYQDDFRGLLQQLVVMIVMIALLVMFSIFLIWIGSVIRPLNQMVRYLQEAPKKKRFIKLDADRQDEIGDVARSLIEMEQEIKKQEKVKLEMIHNISHDLKTPITTIKSYGESIKDGIYPYKTLEKSLDVIIENADRLERKAHTLLLLNQVDALEDKPIVLESVDMKQVVNKVLLSLKVVRPEIEVKVKLTNAIFQGEEENWRICLENLLDNALRYAVSEIVIELTDNWISVYNDGDQMSQDRIDKLFKPYEKGTDGQFGLGLSIVDRLSRRMGYKTSGYNKNSGVEFRIEKVQEEVTVSKMLRRIRKTN